MNLTDIFPRPLDKPNSRQILFGALYWPIRLFLLALLVNMFFVLVQGDTGYDPYIRIEVFPDSSVEDYDEWYALYEQYAVVYDGWEGVSGLVPCAIYTLVDLGAVLLIFGSFLSRSLDFFKINRKKNLKIMGIGLLALAVLLGIISPLTGILTPVVDAWNQSPGWLISFPWYFGLLFVVLISPVVVGCLYQATAFSPLCARRPWLAYVAVAALVFLPFALGLLGSASWSAWSTLGTYLSILPIHLCACWVYQKSDNIWTSIFFMMAANLIIVALLYLFPAIPQAMAETL